MSTSPELLLVNDDLVQLRVLAAKLERHGYRVRPCARAREGLELLERHPAIAGVVTDLNMPDLDGWAFCQMLRAERYARPVPLPILVVSATFEGADALQVAAELGAHSFLSAACDSSVLAAAVDLMLRGRRGPPALDVLLVSRPDSGADALAHAFTRARHTVHRAATTAEMWRLAERHHPAIVVLDFALDEGLTAECLPLLVEREAGVVAIVRQLPARTGLVPALLEAGAEACAYEGEAPDHIIDLALRGRRRRALFRTQELLEQRTRRLRDSEERLSAVLAAIPDLLLVQDGGGRILHANPAAGRHLGVDPETLVGQLSQEVLEGSRLRTPTGGVLELEVTTKSIRYGQGEAKLLIARDVTARRVAEREMAVLAQAVAQAGEMIVVTGPDRRIEYVNAAFERMTGYAREDAVGEPVAMLRAPTEETEPRSEEVDGALSRGETWRGRTKRRRRDGTIYTSEGTVSPVRDADGQVVRIVAVERDVTQQLEMEQALRQALKMEAVGTLAGGIAHDFNNLLTNILGYADLILSGAEAGSDTAQLAEVIVTSAGRASELTGQLLGFARGGKHRNVPVDVNETAKGVAKILSRTLDKEIALDTAMEASPSVVSGDPTQIDQVLLNLALNARDALRGRSGASLRFASKNFRMDEAYCARNPGAMPGDYVALSLTDNGCGIPRAILARIFEPFFTTKPPGQGTGMGLSMVYGIVKNHGGTIRVESEEGEGTTFNIFLPVSEGAVRHDSAVVADTPVGGSGRILVVDDESVVRETTALLLRRLGYEVITAADGEEAVVYYRTFSQKVDLVLLDMVMPRMGGRDCFLELKRINPEVRAILASGYGLNEAAQAILDDGVLAFAPKPFRIAALSHIVAKTMRGERLNPTTGRTLPATVGARADSPR